ncbi:MAG: hypothetical protein CMH22_06150 [Methylophaga sp.]|nr:hypothetical protein [Methylophaga sp.]|tara:strand:+ start:47322 stop:47750 length:429 start_codon:yes stop_codon:yes gene_type:complete
MSENKKEELDYAEYGFENNAKFEINGQTLDMLRSLLSQVLDDDIKQSSRLRFKYVNAKTGKEIKKVTDKNRDVAQRVFDVDATMSATPDEYVSPTGQRIMQMLSILNDWHIKNVDKGNGIKLDELAEKYKEFQQPQLQKVED